MPHGLHCVNACKYVDREYHRGGVGLPPRLVRVQVEHCLEQLSEGLLCAADLTPVTPRPVVWEQGSGMGELEGGVDGGRKKKTTMLLGETERVHTCCDHGEGLEWVRKVGVERGAVESHALSRPLPSLFYILSFLGSRLL